MSVSVISIVQIIYLNKRHSCPRIHENGFLTSHLLLKSVLMTKIHQGTLNYTEYIQLRNRKTELSAAATSDMLLIESSIIAQCLLCYCDALGKCQLTSQSKMVASPFPCRKSRSPP